MQELTIPKVRQELSDIADYLRAFELPGTAAQIDFLVTQLHRRKAVRRTPARSPRMTEELQMRIEEYAARNPTASMMQIGTRFGVSSGRVSETLAGKRGD